jgi:membrane-bound serine protease (ClpP class)
MVSGTTIGSATPIITGIPGEEINTTLRKDINAFTTYMQSLASHFNRNASAAGLMVSRGVSYGAENASRLHVIDGLLNAASLQDALSQLNVPAATEIHTPGIKSQALSVLSDPNLDSVLFLLGVFAILADLYHPTLILSVVGGAAIVLALLGLGVFGAPFVSIILMLMGAVFIFLEVKTHHGVSALVGVVIFAIGVLLIFHTPPPPQSLPSNQPPPANFFGIGLVTYILLGLLGGGIVIGSLYLYRLREAITHKTKAFDPSRLIGRVGYLTSDLKAGGSAAAHIESEDWTVISDEDLAKGTAIKVKEARGIKLFVEREES